MSFLNEFMKFSLLKRYLGTRKGLSIIVTQKVMTLVVTNPKNINGNIRIPIKSQSPSRATLKPPKIVSKVNVSSKPLKIETYISIFHILNIIRIPS